MPDFEIVDPATKKAEAITPYLTIPLIKVCTQKCNYCGDGAEMTLSDCRQFDTENVLEWWDAAKTLGVSKVRITGGEPLIHRDFQKILHTIAKDAAVVLVNTNGTLLERFPDKWQDAPSNVQFVVNYHGATEETYNAVAGTVGHYHLVRRGIEELNKRGMLYRLNAVLNSANQHEFWQIIEYCRDLGVNLKIQDVVSVPWAFNEWSDVFVSSETLEAEFEKAADRIRDHEYAKSFGTPTKIYSIDGVDVTLKSVRNGAQYDMDGICKGCPYFPCHEGIYDMFAFADDSLWACNWVEIAKAPGTIRKEKLAYMIELFQRVSYLPAKKRQRGMAGLRMPAPQELEFVDATAPDIEVVGET